MPFPDANGLHLEPAGSHGRGTGKEAGDGWQGSWARRVEARLDHAAGNRGVALGARRAGKTVLCDL